MLPMLQDKRILVLGLGNTGLSAVRWLSRCGARVRVADSRVAPPRLAELRAENNAVTVVTGAFNAPDFAWAEIIVVSPGVPLGTSLVDIARKGGVPVIGDVELFAQTLAARGQAAPKLIAITGANGKSTVTSMVGAMCRQAGMKTVMAGNIGLPVLDALHEAEITGWPDVYVVELSSFQLETTSSLNAAAAAMLNISADHMDRYASLATYAAAKARIFSGSGAQILNRDDRLATAMMLSSQRVVTFGLDSAPGETDVGFCDGWLMEGEQHLMKASELSVSGYHNIANALAALALCRTLALPLPPLLDALRGFRGLPHRMMRIGEIRGVVFYDDSKGTNVGAAVAALRGFEGKSVLIAGGDGKGQDFSSLRSVVEEKARAVVLLGRDAPRIREALAGSGVALIAAASMEAAVTLAFEAARPGDAVLLSPACASFDMFRHYAHRAEVFTDAVRHLATAVVNV